MLKQKVLLGLSGGVDSSVAAYLLKKDYDVLCMFMRNWDSLLNNDIRGNKTIHDEICPQEKDYNDARSVADHLNIQIERVDFIKEYYDYVFEYFLDEYKKGRTPNPDVMCNKYIKFSFFKEKMKENNCSFMATGHYANVIHYKDHSILLRAKDLNKDQTYFLCLLSQEQLRNVLFPVGNYLKEEIREIAKKEKLPTFNKKDSTGICFIGERNFKEFLKNYIYTKKGNIVTKDGKIVGTHDGIMYYTIGQRKGLNIGGCKDYLSEPWFVIGKCLLKNELIVGQGKDDIYLLSNNLYASNYNFIHDIPDQNKEYTAKFRYRQKDIPVYIKIIDENRLHVIYKDTSRAVTNGQIVCFYDGDICLGGAIIEEVYLDNDTRNYY